MIKILLIEDDYPLALDLVAALSGHGDYETEIVTTYSEAVEKVRNNQFDIILSDIYLDGDYTAFDVFESVKLESPIIFLSTNNTIETYLETKEYNTYLYIVKPFDPVTLISAIDNCVKDKVSPVNHKDVIFIQNGKKTISVNISDIKYITTKGNYCLLELNEQNIFTRTTMSKLIERINHPLIARVHRQYAINIDKIDSVDFSNNTIHAFSKSIDIGRKYKKSFKELLVKK